MAQQPRSDVMTVLLVEDMPLDRELFQANVGDVFTILQAQTLREAEAMLGGVNPPRVDVIALDLGLPDASGLQALDTIHAMMPDIPIVVFTLSLGGEDAVKAMQAGASAVVMKQDVATMTQMLKTAVLRARTHAASVIRRQAFIERELQRERQERELAEERIKRRDLENQLLREQLAPSGNYKKLGMYVRAVMVLVVVTLVILAAIYISRPGENNVPIVTAILGFIVPTVGALLAAALQQTNTAVNGRLSQLVQVTAENAANAERAAQAERRSNGG